MLKKIKNKIIKKIKTNKIKSALAFIALILLFVFTINGNDNEIHITEKPSLEALEQIVSVSGTVETNQKIDLRFQSSGKVKSINFNVGDKVEEYSLISELDNDLQENSVSSALAKLNIAKAELNLAYAGPTKEEQELALIKIEEAELNYKNSQNNLENILLSQLEQIKKAELELDTATEAFNIAGFDLEASKETLENEEDTSAIALNNAYENAENQVEDILVSNINSINKINDYQDVKSNLNTNYDLIFGENYGKLYISTDLSNIEFLFKKLEKELGDYQKNPNRETLYEILMEQKDILELLYNTSTLIQTIINFNKNDDGELSNQTVATYKTTLDAEITTISSKLTTINSLIEAIDLAEINYQNSLISLESGSNTADLDYIKLKNNLDIAESNLQNLIAQNAINENNAKLDVDLKEVYLRQAKTNYDQLIAEPRAVDVASLKSKISEYNSNYNRTLIELENTKIYSPSTGVITDIAMDVGENIASTETVVTIINDKLQILANISETEIAKLRIADPVRLNLDAFSLEQEYSGKVIKIDPAETVIQGVVYYQTTILFDEYDEAIRPGMTVNLEIITESINETLQIPIQALHYDDDKVYVYLLEAGEKIRQYIKTGIEGDYNIEVLEGLSLSDDVIIYEKN